MLHRGSLLSTDDDDARQELVPLATAPNQIVAELWIGALRGEGVSAVMDIRDTMSFLGVSNWPVRLLVQESRLAEATAILKDFPAGYDTEQFDDSGDN